MRLHCSHQSRVCLQKIYPATKGGSTCSLRGGFGAGGGALTRLCPGKNYVTPWRKTQVGPGNPGPQQGADGLVLVPGRPIRFQQLTWRCTERTIWFEPFRRHGCKCGVAKRGGSGRALDPGLPGYKAWGTRTRQTFLSLYTETTQHK